MIRVRVAFIAALAAAAVACGSAEEAFPRVVTLGESDVYVNILNSGLGVGENRFLLGVSDVNDEPILAASLRLRFFSLVGDDASFRFETDARFVPIELGFIDEQSGRVREVTGEGGAYVASAKFDRAGDWGVKIRIKRPGEDDVELPFRFNVLERTLEPAIGDRAPRSQQQTLATAASIDEIDSSFPPRPAMHDTTIAAAIDARRPAVVAFATPAYCTSRLCAPVMDTVMDPLAARYAGRATFIHIEPYVLSDLRASFRQNAVPATREWRLESEPWIFVIGADGRVAAKFEGVVALDEVEAALMLALGDS